MCRYLERTVRWRKPGVMPLLVWPAQKYMPESLSVVDGILRESTGSILIFDPRCFYCI